MREIGGRDHASVGMRRPSGEYERPIPETRLFWTKPGNIVELLYLQQTTHLPLLKDRKILAVVCLVIYLFGKNLLHEANPRGKFSFR